MVVDDLRHSERMACGEFVLSMMHEVYGVRIDPGDDTPERIEYCFTSLLSQASATDGVFGRLGPYSYSGTSLQLDSERIPSISQSCIEAGNSGEKH